MEKTKVLSERQFGMTWAEIITPSPKCLLDSNKRERVQNANEYILMDLGLKTERRFNIEYPLCPQCGKASLIDSQNPVGRVIKLSCHLKECGWLWTRPPIGGFCSGRQNGKDVIKYQVLKELAAMHEEGLPSVTTDMIVSRLANLSMSQIRGTLERGYSREYILRTEKRRKLIPVGSAYFYALSDRGKGWLSWAEAQEGLRGGASH